MPRRRYGSKSAQIVESDIVSHAEAMEMLNCSMDDLERWVDLGILYEPIFVEEINKTGWWRVDIIVRLVMRSQLP